MEAVLERRNMEAALRRVKKNRGSPGVDGMTTDELLPYLRGHWARIRASLLDSTYTPAPIKRQSVPKSGGGTRELGIPTVLDRLIQQALLQVLQPIFDPTFSEHSFGFRPGRSAHDALRAATRHVQSGHRVVVDVDLEKFFDRVHHDVLMGKLAKRIEDRRVLRLIRRYLQSGVMVDGVLMQRWEGTPQGGPLSPLLANVLLDEVDKELEVRGHAFVRYADDARVFVRSQRAGERVLGQLRTLFGRLRLRINEAKSAVAPAWDRPFLGYSMWVAPGKTVRLRVARKALDKMKDRVRQITRRHAGRSLSHVIGELRSYLLGWHGYFALAATPRLFATLDQWIRRRLRALQLHQWKRGRTVFRELRLRGASTRVAAEVAAQTHRWWWNACHRVHLILRNSHFAQLGLPQLAP
ncbi:Group II intron-encoded protein LtrA [Planctomycetes bacterium Pla86]|uniref:RNA-directed DNA polymerase n=2 Tax=Engelhardtia mirabilis TaxID=2528011 RepID=A0A518BQZ9_9BACT|nr:Group II intron-encoded protein LtrA [Planctomycetes bacterium Pla133]QDU69407.1 Group II intron-encoded protein LtrA [Planctomycetes bacterium Pla133]QDV02799.1 Group II intron-encoded protein LtrA [Planctomycetes bacterium Pla86]QDV03733.1 Group II intron-encoded protein LtrA [Planctomycetes bacterium Pla86]